MALLREGVADPAKTLRVMEFDGRLTFGAQSNGRYEELCRFLEEGAREVVFDLTRVGDVDSAGIGFLVMCLTTVHRFGAALRLAAPSNRVLYALLVTKLDSVFPIFESVEAALTARRA